MKLAFRLVIDFLPVGPDNVPSLPRFFFTMQFLHKSIASRNGKSSFARKNLIIGQMAAGEDKTANKIRTSASGLYILYGLYRFKGTLNRASGAVRSKAADSNSIPSAGSVGQYGH